MTRYRREREEKRREEFITNESAMEIGDSNTVNQRIQAKHGKERKWEEDSQTQSKLTLLSFISALVER